MEKKNTEAFQVLEEELLQKRAEMSQLLGKVQDIPAQVGEQLGKISDFTELKTIGDAIVEMEKTVAEKRADIQGKLRDMQAEMASLKKLGEETTVEDIKGEMEDLLERVKEKKKSLEKAIKEVDEIREHYRKMFLG